MLWKKQQQKSNKRCSEFRGVFFSPFSLLCTFASLKSACYYAMCPLSPLWNNFITSGKHSEYMLRKMILRRPWASDWTSASPTEARGLFGKGLFLVISAYCYRKEEPKMGIGYGALESLSQCIQALAGTVELRGCCAETWNAESRICQKLTSEAGAGFTWATTVCGEYDEEKNVVAKASCWDQKLATQSHMIQTSLNIIRHTCDTLFIIHNTLKNHLSLWTAAYHSWPLAFFCFYAGYQVYWIHTQVVRSEYQEIYDSTIPHLYICW